MMKWLVKLLLGRSIKKIEKSITQSSTTRTVAVASISTVAIVRAVVYALAELGFIPDEMKEEVVMVILAVGIPLVSRLLAIVKAKFND